MSLETPRVGNYLSGTFVDPLLEAPAAEVDRGDQQLDTDHREACRQHPTLDPVHRLQRLGRSLGDRCLILGFEFRFGSCWKLDLAVCRRDQVGGLVANLKGRVTGGFGGVGQLVPVGERGSDALEDVVERLSIRC